MAEDIVSELGLMGSNGVDFLLTKRGPVVVEVNPRFQGSLDAVELSTGINIFKAHVEAFSGILPEKPLPRKVAGRAILFAQRSVKIGDELTGRIKDIDWITDVPRPGTEINKNDPVASVLAIGKDREEVLLLLIERTDMLRTATNSQN
jgi:predicted ATP-grasp superfamily ATP-dependent carboligase